MQLTLFRKVVEFLLAHKIKRSELPASGVVTWEIVPKDLPKPQGYPRTEEGEP